MLTVEIAVSLNEIRPKVRRHMCKVQRTRKIAVKAIVRRTKNQSENQSEYKNEKTKKTSCREVSLTIRFIE